MTRQHVLKLALWCSTWCAPYTSPQPALRLGVWRGAGPCHGSLPQPCRTALQSAPAALSHSLTHLLRPQRAGATSDSSLRLPGIRRSYVPRLSRLDNNAKLLGSMAIHRSSIILSSRPRSTSSIIACLYWDAM